MRRSASNPDLPRKRPVGSGAAALLLAAVAALLFWGAVATPGRTAELLGDCGSPARISGLAQWPGTDFTRCTVRLDGIRSGGPGKDGIPAIDEPLILTVPDAPRLDPGEPVISISINGEARAWPLQVLIWHEIANDMLGGVPVAATYCPLCNAAIVFDRRLDGRILDFGTTGNLRKSDLVMYDRQTESWWQQYTGEAIVGVLAGRKLEIMASRLESWGEFTARHPDGTVLVPRNPQFRPYGTNPYRGYDTSSFPFLFDGEVPEGIAPLDRVVVAGGKAWALELLRDKGRITEGGITLDWRPGQRSALDTSNIADGRDVGTVTATRDGRDIPYEVTFAFVYHAFNPGKEIVLD